MSRIYEKLKFYADQTPDHVAFTYREGEQYQTLGYDLLKQYVDSLAAHLCSYRGKTIAIIGNNKLEYAVALLSILSHVGNAFLIDKELSKEDIKGIFKQKKPDLILLDDEINHAFEEYTVWRFCEIHDMMTKGRMFDGADAFAGQLILHTSGTTGEPKCVQLTEENYYGVIPELNRKWGVVQEHSCLFIIPLYHIYALVSLFHGLYAGINNILEWDYKRIGQVLKETKPHLFMGVPLMYNRIKDAALGKAGKKLEMAIKVSNLLRKCGIDVRKKWFHEIHAYFGGNYVFGVSAGSLLPYETGRFFEDIGLPVYNVYGMTETSGPVAINYKGHNRYDSVGEILEINQVHILEKDADGVGRICVKGSNVFGGYLGKEFDDPSSGKGVYFETGDRGYVKDGYLYVLGRERSILIGSNGKNISQEELRRKFLEYPGIHDCNVIMTEDMLIALVNTELGEDEVRKCLDHVNRKLPRYKRVSDIRVTHKKLK